MILMLFTLPWGNPREASTGTEIQPEPSLERAATAILSVHGRLSPAVSRFATPVPSAKTWGRARPCARRVSATAGGIIAEGVIGTR